ncbi:MAG: depolymerase esterase [Massilia sp.]|nr:depolymerase esterase [Massilia sp.]
MVKRRASLLGAMLRVGRQQQRMLGALMAPPAAPKARKKAAVKATPAAGAWLSLSFVNLTARMRYWLYLPASAAPGVPLPLAVMLHGCEQSAADFADGTRMNLAAEKAGYAVLYPQQSAVNHPQRCWKWYDRATQQGGGDAALIAAVVRAVLAAYPIDRRRVYIGGISAGAAMANIVALNFPGLFAALGMHSGPVFGAGHSRIGALGVMQHGAAARAEEAIAEVLLRQSGPAHLPTLVIHGEDDAVVRPVNQMQLAGQALHLNALGGESVEKLTEKAATRRTRAHLMRDVYRGRKLMLRMVRIAGLKHAWSGGDERFKFNAAAGPDASKLFLDFFSRHALI